jgi:hypothetical protein
MLASESEEITCVHRALHHSMPFVSHQRTKTY